MSNQSVALAFKPAFADPSLSSGQALKVGATPKLGHRQQTLRRQGRNQSELFRVLWASKASAQGTRRVSVLPESGVKETILA